MAIPLPSFEAITNLISDSVSHGSFEHCQLLAPSVSCPCSLTTTGGAIITAYEIVGVHRYLTSQTEQWFLQDIEEALESVLRTSHRKMDIIYVRDPERTEDQLDEIYSSTMDTIDRLGIEAKHFFEQQKKDLVAECSYEKTYLVLTTKPEALPNRAPTKAPTLNGQSVIIESIPTTAQNYLRESTDLLQLHQGFCKNLTAKLDPVLGLTKLTKDEYLKVVKQEEDLISLEREGWQSKSIGDSVDLSLNESGDNFLAYPPLAYQLIPNHKDTCKQDRTIIESNSKFIAVLDREYFPIKSSPFSEFINVLSRNIPIRMAFSLELGTKEIIANLNSRKGWLMFFLWSKQSRNVDKALSALIEMGENQNKTLMSGHLTVATWASTLSRAKEYKREVNQAIQSWGSQITRIPPNVFKGYFSTLPAFSKAPSSRSCVQSLSKHLATLPITRPSSPMKTGGLCCSTRDGRLFPIDPTTESQRYSLNVIVGDMGSGKTVFSSILNDTYVFGKGNETLPLIGYMDFGTGVHNYFSSLKARLPTSQQHLAELIPIRNESGMAFNIFEPLFGLNELTTQELAFCKSFVSRLINGHSDKPVHEQIASVVHTLLSSLFDSLARDPIGYEQRIAIYANEENRFHTEINELLNHDVITIGKHEHYAWYTIRDKLYQIDPVKWGAHARFAHRQGSATLDTLMKHVASSNQLREALSAYTTSNGTALIKHIEAALSGVLSEYNYIFGMPSQLDLSQARIIGVDLAWLGTSQDDTTVYAKRLFGLLAKHMTTKNFWMNEKDFLPKVSELYRDYYTKIIRINRAIKKHQFIDEYKQSKSPEMDALLDAEAFIQRKYNICTTIAMQQLEHSPNGYLKLASNIFCLSLSAEDSIILKTKYKLSESFIGEAERVIGNSDGFGLNLLYIGKFKKFAGHVIQILRNHITPSYLWNFSSGVVDEQIKSLARARYGDREAFTRLGILFPSGSADNYITNRINAMKYETKTMSRADCILEIVDKLHTID